MDNEQSECEGCKGGTEGGYDLSTDEHHVSPTHTHVKLPPSEECPVCEAEIIS